MGSDKRFKVAVLIFVLCGLIFSGYLTFYYYWGDGCAKALIHCGAGPKTVKIFGQPTCVYGFFMFLATAVTVLLGWAKTNTRPYLNTIFWLSVVGVLFSGGLSFYELVFLKTGVYGVPACVYGLFFYLGIFISAYLWRNKMFATPPTAAPTPPPTTPTT